MEGKNKQKLVKYKVQIISHIKDILTYSVKADLSHISTVSNHQLNDAGDFSYVQYLLSCKRYYASIYSSTCFSSKLLLLLLTPTQMFVFFRGSYILDRDIQNQCINHNLNHISITYSHKLVCANGLLYVL